MRVLLGLGLLTAIGGAAWLVTTATAQPPGGPPPGRGRDRGRPADIAGAVEKMMTFDSDKDGSLTKEEVTDTRLVALFESADANQDGKVSTEELTAQLTKDAEDLGPGGGPPGGGPDWGGPPGGGPDRRGPDRRDPERRGPERRGPGGFGGPGGPGGLGGPGGPDRPMGPGGPFGPGFGGPPPIGQVLPGPLQEMLKLSPVQRRQIEGLQRNVDRRLSEILTEDQLEQLERMKNRGPMGPGDPRGPGGPRGRGGPPEREGPRDRDADRDRERPRDRRDNRDDLDPPPRRPEAEEER